MVAAKSNSELIAGYLDAVIRKDASAVDSYVDPNVEYMVNGTLETDADGALPPISAECHSALPWLGLHRGREAVKEFLSHMLDVLDHCKPTSMREPITCNSPETNMFYFSFTWRADALVSRGSHGIRTKPGCARCLAPRPGREWDH
jgi:hypothetical protein